MSALKKQSKLAQSKNNQVEKKQRKVAHNALEQSRNRNIPILLLAGERKSNGGFSIFLM